MTVDEAVGERVHQIMWRKRLQQIDVAPAAGMDQSGLSKRIRGKRSWSLEDLLRIAQVLDVDPAELIVGLTPANGIAIGARPHVSAGGSRANSGYQRTRTRRNHPALTNRDACNRSATRLRLVHSGPWSARAHTRCA